MKCRWPTIVLVLLMLASSALTQRSQKLILNHTDELEVVFEEGRYKTYVNGNVEFQTETGRIFCDSAVFVRNNFANLRGNVFIDDQEYMLRADSVFYDLLKEQAVARGRNVQLWSYDDSLYGAGTHAFYDRTNENFYMENRPTIYLGYPDSVSMVEIIADFVEYRKETEQAEAIGDVIITSEDLAARSRCAVMNLKTNVLDLYDAPSAQRARSTIEGGFISLVFGEEQLERILVIDSAYGEFIEPVDTTATEFDRSILAGERLTMYFTEGELSQVKAVSQAYSWYYPSQRGTTEFHENEVSGDTIRFAVKEQSLQRVTVIGGARGTYVTGKVPYGWSPEDSVEVPTADTLIPLVETPADTAAVEADTTMGENAPRPRLDTINYRAHYIEYSLVDSIISLRARAEVGSGTMGLRAHDVEFDTQRRTVEAFSAEINPDSLDVDYYNLADRLQPATIPVTLKDGSDELYGDYLEYSIDTEKGRIITSKSEFEQGYYYGNKLFREKKDVYYVEDGYYTTCDAEEPHFHFHSKRMKLIENNKLIARPVVFSIGRIPLLALPYYVFPLKKGRHSGILEFRFGRFERGERYLENLGYYWAASEYWDWRGWVDYHEQRRTLTFGSRVNFVKRYILNGYLDLEYRRQTNYNRFVGRESTPNSYKINAQYDHKFTPSFEVRSFASYQSTANYETDFSNNLSERLNRELLSRASFSKRFGEQISLSGSVEHRENLDLETRTNQLPTASLSLPSIYPFGSSSTNEDGDKVSRWYNQFILRYNPSLQNFSSRATKTDTVLTVLADTTIIVDTLANDADTTIQIIEADTLRSRTRRHWAKIEHNPSISLPSIRLQPYITISPRISYRETWFKIWETDQSRAAGIDASETYRTYSYNAGAEASTKLYGTIYPNFAGVIGVRHVFEPRVGYSWSPEIQRHPSIRAFAGGGAASSKSQRLTFRFNQLFQAKVGNEEAARNLDLLSINSNFSYDLEQDERPLSDMRTNFSTSTIPRINLNGSMTHTFYSPIDGHEDFISPWLTDINFDVTFSIAGSKFLFSDATREIPRGVDSANQLDERQPTRTGRSGNTGWNLSVKYSFSESNRHTNYQKSSFVSTTLSFSLTPSTSVTYSQHYDIGRNLTTYSSVSIRRNLHCWEGSIFWVPNGANRGFGFRLNVIDIPSIKLDSNHDSFLSSDLVRQQY